MHTVFKWAAVCGVAFAVNLAALAGASALTLPEVPLKADAVPRAIEVRKGGGMSGGPIIRRMGGGGRHAISQGGRMPRIHSGGRGGYRAIQYGGRGNYRIDGRGRDYAVRSGKIRRNNYYNQYQGQVSSKRLRRVRYADGRYYGGRKYNQYQGQASNKRVRRARYGDGRYYGGKKYNHYNPRHHGQRYKHKHGKYKHYHDGWWYAWPWWSVGIGIGIGSYWGDYWDVPAYDGYDAHVAWCLRRYRSYDPASDTYLGYDGRYHQCISPYMY